MTLTRSPSAALPIARIVLRILMVLNWLMAPMIIALLVISVVGEDKVLAAFKLSSPLEAARVLNGLRLVAVLGLVALPFNHLVLRRLLAIVDTVRGGDPFVAANAQRLQTIAWSLLVLNVLSIVIGAIGASVSTRENPVDLNAGFSINGWLAVLLTFILARVFAEGTIMREDLEGTV